MSSTAIQLYSLRGIDEPLPEVLDAVAATSFEGVEFASDVRGTDTERVARALDRTGLAVAGVHVTLEALEEAFETIAAIADQFGCDRLIVPYLDDRHFESEAAVQSTAERLSAVAATARDRGFELHYHNHDHEFVDLGERTAMEALLERTDERVRFELDLGWALAGGTDPVSLLDRYGDRISVVHVADVDTESQSSVELGDGDLDLEACSEACRTADIEWSVYEYDDPSHPRESLAHGAATLREWQ